MKIVALTNTPSVGRLRPSHCQPRASLGVGFASLHLRLTTTAVCGTIMCQAYARAPAAPCHRLRFVSVTPSLHVVPGLRSRLSAQHNIFGDYVLAFHRHLRLRLRCRLAPLHSQSATSVCFSGSSMPLRYTPSCTRRLSSIFTFHPLDRGVCHCYHPPAHLLYAHPGPRCAVRRCTDSTPATRATAALTSSSLRLTARRGRLMVLVQVHDKEPVVP